MLYTILISLKRWSTFHLINQAWMAGSRVISKIVMTLGWIYCGYYSELSYCSVNTSIERQSEALVYISGISRSHLDWWDELSISLHYEDCIENKNIIRGNYRTMIGVWEYSHQFISPQIANAEIMNHLTSKSSLMLKRRWWGWAISAIWYSRLPT